MQTQDKTRPGRSVRTSATQQTLTQIFGRGGEIHGCILHSELNIYRLFPYAGTTATEQTYTHEFMTHTTLHLISQ